MDAVQKSSPCMKEKEKKKKKRLAITSFDKMQGRERCFLMVLLFLMSRKNKPEWKTDACVIVFFFLTTKCGEHFYLSQRA